MTRKQPDRNNSIVLLERDHSMRSTHAVMLQTHGYDVECTGNEAEAHMLCGSVNPALVLVGASEPFDTMWKVCEKLQRRNPLQRIALVFNDSVRLCPMSFEGGGTVIAEGPDDLLKRVQDIFSARE